MMIAPAVRNLFAAGVIACGAVAVASNGAYGSGWATRLDVAESYAVNSCQQYGNNSCRVTRWVCTDY